MSNGSKPIIFGPDGKSMTTEPLIVVVKAPQSLIPRLQQMAMATSKLLGAVVLVMPINSELLTGEVAKQELDFIHQAIHTIEAKGKKQLGGYLAEPRAT